MYLTAILRDYLRAFARNTYAIGNALFEMEGDINYGIGQEKIIGKTIINSDILTVWHRGVCLA